MKKYNWNRFFANEAWVALFLSPFVILFAYLMYKINTMIWPDTSIWSWNYWIK